MSAPRHRADPRDGLRIVPLDSLTAIYHRRSGATHLVAEPVPDILAALEAAPLDAPALLAKLGLASDAEALAALEERLAELEALGLVFRA